MDKAPRFPITVTKILSPESFYGREVPGPNMSTEALNFKKMCQELNHYMNDQRSPMNISASGITPNEAEAGEVFVARRQEDRTWYRVSVKMVTRRLQGPEATCELLDHGDEMRVPLSAIRKLPEKFKSFPFQVKQFGLFGLQPQTLVTCPEDMTTSYQLCIEWDLAATDYMRKTLEVARDVLAEVVGITDENIRWIRVHLDHIDGTCLNNMLVDNGYACMTKTEKDYNFVEQEPLFPSQKIQTRARPPKFVAGESDWMPASGGHGRPMSDAEMTYSGCEGEKVSRERSRAKRTPLVPRFKGGASGTGELDVHSDIEGKREVTPETAARIGMRGVSPRLETTSPKLRGVSPMSTIGRGGFLSPGGCQIAETKPGLNAQKDLNVAITSDVQQNDIASNENLRLLNPGVNIKKDLNAADAQNQGVNSTGKETSATTMSPTVLKSPPREMQTSQQLRTATREPSPGFVPSPTVGRGFLSPVSRRQPGSLQEKSPSSPTSVGLAEREKVPSSARPDDSVIAGVKSPPRKQMKPHVPARAKISPGRPSRAAGKTSDSSQDEAKLTPPRPVGVRGSPGRAVFSPKSVQQEEAQTQSLISPGLGRGFLTGRGFLRVQNDEVKPHGLQEKEAQKVKAMSPPKALSQESGVDARTSPLIAALPQNVFLERSASDEGSSVSGRGCHRKAVTSSFERKPESLPKCVYAAHSQNVVIKEGAAKAAVSHKPETVAVKSRDSDHLKAQPKSYLVAQSSKSGSEVSRKRDNELQGLSSDKPILMPVGLGRGISPTKTFSLMSHMHKVNQSSVDRGQVASHGTRGDVATTVLPGKGILPKPGERDASYASPKSSGSPSISSEMPSRSPIGGSGGRGKILNELLHSSKFGSPDRDLKENKLHEERKRSADKEYIKRDSGGRKTSADIRSDKHQSPQNYVTASGRGPQKDASSSKPQDYLSATSPRCDNLKRGLDTRTTPERKMNGVFQKVSSPPLCPGRGKQLAMMLGSISSISPEKSIKNEIIGCLLDKSPMKDVPPMPDKMRDAVVNVNELERLEDSAKHSKNGDIRGQQEVKGSDVVKNFLRGASRSLNEASRTLGFNEPAVQVEGVNSSVAAKATSQPKDTKGQKVSYKGSKHAHERIKANQSEPHMSSEDELMTIMNEARTKEEGRSMCSPVNDRTESATPKDIEDVERMLGSVMAWQGSKGEAFVSSYQSTDFGYSQDLDVDCSGSPVRSAAEMAWYSFDTKDGEEVKDTQRTSIPNDAEDAEIDGAIADIDVSSPIDVGDASGQAISAIVSEVVEQISTTLTVKQDFRGDKIVPDNAVEKPEELSSEQEASINVPGLGNVPSAGKVKVDVNEPLSSLMSVPDGASAIVSMSQTLVAVASPTIAESCLFVRSSSVDPADYTLSPAGVAQYETNINTEDMPTLVPFYSDDEMPELEADDMLESGVEDQSELPKSDNEMTESQEAMPELEQHPHEVMQIKELQETMPELEQHVSEMVRTKDGSSETIPESQPATQEATESIPVKLANTESSSKLTGESKGRNLHGEESCLKPVSENPGDDTNPAMNVSTQNSACLEGDGRERELHSAASITGLPGPPEETTAPCLFESRTSTDEESLKSQQTSLQGAEAQGQSSDASTSESSKPAQARRSRLPKCALQKLNQNKASPGGKSDKDGKESKSTDNRSLRGRSRSVTFSDEDAVLDTPRRQGIKPTISDDDEDDEEERALLKEIQERAIRQQQLRLQETFALGDDQKVIGFANFEYFEKEEEVEDTLEKGVFLDGKITLTSCPRVQDSNLFEAMILVYTDRQIRSTTTLQSYVWPALNRGLSMVIISQRYTPANTLASKVDPIVRLTRDVTTAYLPPMISKYLYESGELEGAGPLGVILCSGWRRVEWVLDQCRSYCAHIRLRTEALYGSCGESAMEVTLLNGCDILVATPNSLLRMLDKMIIDFKRVMHMVFDDGEVLTEQFTESLTKVMSQYYLDVENRDNREPSQLILCGQHWSQPMADFMTKCFPQPHVVIQAKLEAAIYADTRFVVEMCPKKSQLQHLSTVTLDPSVNVKMRTLVCCKDRETVNRVAEVLRAQTHHVLVALDISYPHDLEKVRQEWKTSGQNPDHKPILVACDNVLEELQIDNIERVIHFDLPTKAAFVGRLWTMRANFAQLAKKIKNSNVEKTKNAPPLQRCESVTLMTEDDMLYAPAIVELLRRVQAKVPKSLDALAERARREKEEFSTVPLCQHMCAFGQCRLGRQCQGRHVINADMDGKTSSHCIKLPAKGYAKIKVMHVVDASFLWARLIEHSDHGVSVAYNRDFARMTMTMNTYLCVPSNRKPIIHPSKGDLIAVEDIQHTWHRAKILALGKYNKDGYIEEVDVFMVDIGEVRQVRLKHSCQLPENVDILRVPYQAFRVFIADVKPFDDDLEWTRQASLAMATKIGGKELNGRIVLSLGDTMWLVNLHEQERLAATNIRVQSETVTAFLFRERLAVKNHTHIPLLYSACEGKIDLPEVFQVSQTPGMGYDLYQRPVNFETVKLTSPTKNHQSQKVIIPIVESPELFYVQRDEAEKLIMDLHFDIQDHLRLGDIEATTNSLIKAGSLVLARMPAAENPEEDDIKWYRCKVLRVTENNEYEVFYLDFGDIYPIPSEGVRPMPLRFLRPEFQAVECQLASVKSLVSGHTWTDEAVNGFFSIVWTEEDKAKILEAKLISREESKTAGLVRYSVKLIDRADGFPVDVAMEMVARRYAAPTHLFLQNLFVTNDQGKILDLVNLCRKLIVSSDAGQQKTIIDSIHDCCAAIIADEQDERLHEILSHLGQMLGYVPNAGNIMGALTSIMDMLLPEEMTEKVLPGAKEIILNLFRILRRIDDYNGKCSALVCLIKLADHDSCQSYITSECNGLEFLTRMLRSTMEGDLALLLVKLLYGLLPGALSYAKGVIESDAINVICQCLASTEDKNLIEWCCMALQQPAARDRWNAEIRKAKVGMKLCKALTDIDDARALTRILQLLEILCETNTFTVEYFQECGLREKLQILSSQPRLSNQVKELVDSILILIQLEEDDFVVDNGIIPTRLVHQEDMLNVNVPTPQGMRALPAIAPELVIDDQRITNRQPPHVKWSQDKYNIVLIVEVHDVKAQEPVMVQENMVNFRAAVLGTEYYFSFALYELIIPSECQVEILNSCVNIGLRKVSKGRWPRLLKQKTVKPAYLSFDFEHSLTTDSESSEDEQSGPKSQEPPLRLLKRRRNKKRLPLPQSSPTKGDNFSNIIPSIPEFDYQSADSSDSSDVVVEREYDEYNIFDVKNNS